MMVPDEVPSISIALPRLPNMTVPKPHATDDREVRAAIDVDAISSISQHRYPIRSQSNKLF